MCLILKHSDVAVAQPIDAGDDGALKLDRELDGVDDDVDGGGGVLHDFVVVVGLIVGKIGGAVGCDYGYDFGHDRELDGC